MRASNHIFGIRDSGFMPRITFSRIEIRDSGFGARITFSGFGHFRDPGFGIRASNHIFRDSGFGHDRTRLNKTDEECRASPSIGGGVGGWGGPAPLLTEHY